MRVRALAAAVLALALAACDQNVPAELMPPPAPSFETTFAEKLKAIEPFYPVRQDWRYQSGEANILEALEQIHWAWGYYLSRMEGVSLGDFRSNVVGRAEQYKPADVTPWVPPCGKGGDAPYYCRPRAIGMATGVVVLPYGFSPRLHDVAVDEILWVTGVIAGYLYLDHLQAELMQAHLIWPRGPLFDWCVIGISLRSLMSGSMGTAIMPKVLKTVDSFIGSSPANVAGYRDYMLRRGYVTGRPQDCSYNFTAATPTALLG